MNKTKNNYSIGLDLGVGSIGWALVDDNDKLIKKGRKNLWGVHLFDEANSAQERRMHRRARRTISKRTWRLHLLQTDLKQYVNKEDPNFFENLKLSHSSKGVHSLFVGKYSDINYHKEFPTIYHLRSALMDSKKVENYKKRGLYYRFLYLALSDVLKTRGNFLTEGTYNSSGRLSKEEIINITDDIISELRTIGIIIDDKFVFNAISSVLNNEIVEGLKSNNPTNYLIRLLIGRNVDINKIFDLGDTKVEVCFKNENWEDNLPAVDQVDDLILRLGDLYAAIRINVILGDAKHISEAKIKIYEQHKKQLAELKVDIKVIDKLLDKSYYQELFVDINPKKASYSSYVGKELKDGKKYSVKKYSGGSPYAEFIKVLKGIKDIAKANNLDQTLLADIDKEDYLSIQTSTDNRLIPYQIHYLELNEILNVFVALEKNKEAEKVRENILQIMKFKVPYYVGPLANKDNLKDVNYWLVKNEGYKDNNVNPFNFDEVVDKIATNEAFITRMLRSCTYLTNEKCMQQETIGYQTYIFYNTVNKIKINDNYLSKDQKDILRDNVVKGASITKKRLLKLLNIDNAEVSGFSKTDDDKPLAVSLSSLRKFKKIFGESNSNQAYMHFYDDVVDALSFVDDNQMALKHQKLDELIKSYTSIIITEVQKIELVKLKSVKWGNLSYKILNEIHFIKDTKTGEADSLLNILRNSNLNLIEILHINGNMELIDKENNLTKSIDTSHDIQEYFKKKYISPQARRTITRTIRIIDEIIRIMNGQYPDKIAIEFTREHSKKEETKSRLKQIQEAYKKIESEYASSEENLKSLIENKNTDILKSKRIYLYFLQLGKDLYTGEPIDFNALLTNDHSYDIDHIFPQSRIKDDSLDNLVLTKNVLNGEKGNNYPFIKIQTKNNFALWEVLVKKGLMSSKKHERLKRTTPLTDQELEDFVNRQKTTLDWINLESAKLLDIKYNREGKNDFIIYAKSRHVSAFRRETKLFKFRELNNLHHAHDAYLNVVIGKKMQAKYFVVDGNFKTYNYEKVIRTSMVPIKDYVAKILAYHDPLVTKMTKINSQGAFWDQNMVQPKDNGKNDNLAAIKNGLNVNERGGYNGVKTAFFTAIEKKGKVKILAIPTVDCSKFYYKDVFDETKFKDYIRLTHGECTIIVPIIPIGQKIVVNKVPLLLAGKTNDKLTVHSTTQTILTKDNQEFLRKLVKLMSIYRNDEFTETYLKINDIDDKGNTTLFNELSTRIVDGFEVKNIYTRIPYNIVSNIIFEELSTLEQCQLMIAIVGKLIFPNKANQGKILKSYNDLAISSNITYPFSIIKQSITGYYTKTIVVKDV